ncbi:MAG TPA: MFS transporter [Burkholderiales bacterium]|nr:MFS transporter [Burkholderiales bacterium]
MPFVAGYFVSYVFRSLNAILGPQIAAEFGLNAAQLGLLTSVYFLGFGLVQIPAGLLLDRYGPARVDAALLVLAAAGAALFAMAPSYGALVAGRVLIGLGVSVCLMASLHAFVLWYPIERIASLNSRAFAVGILGAVTVSVPLDAALQVVHWRTIAWLLAALTLAISALLWLAVPARPREGPHDSLAQALEGVRALLADAAFRRTAVMIGSSQFAAVSLSTLWIATWLRDVAGYGRAEVAQGLLAAALGLMAGYLVLGRLADARAKSGRSAVPLVAGGIAASSACLLLLASGVTAAALALWMAFLFSSSSAVLGYAILSRRFPRAMAGRVNTTLNTFAFLGMFLGQWSVGLILNLWPPTATGYDPRAYVWAFGMLWLVQLVGLAWFWSGRRLFG